MMEKPVELLKDNEDIDINYCFSWANHTWTKAPGKRDEKVLIRQTYGEKSDWIRHYQYLSEFFSDKRYIKVDNKPVMVIYNAIDIDVDTWNKMSSLWDKMAKDDGWEGIFYISTLKHDKDIKATEDRNIEFSFEYQPTWGVRKTKGKIDYGFWYHLRYNFFNLRVHNRVTRFEYKNVWNSVLKKTENKSNVFLGAFTDWDTSIRWGQKGSVTVNSTPELFEKYMRLQIEKSRELGHEFLFLTAWNEWSEGAYLEPDNYRGTKLLEAVKRANEGNP